MIQTIDVPKYVGGYRIGGPQHSFTINLTSRPCWFHRTMMKWAFGWTWVDGGAQK